VKAVFLFDLDNTLLDDDRFVSDLKAYLRGKLGTRNTSHYLNLVERRKKQVGFADYLGVLQRYAADRPHEKNLVSIARFLFEYPFLERLSPQAIPLLCALKRRGAIPVLFTEGDIVLQSLKIENSGLSAIFEENILIYPKKTGEERDICRRYPRHRFYVIDDEAEVLLTIKRLWKCQPITILLADKKENKPRRGSRSALPDFQVHKLDELLNILTLDRSRRRSR